MNDNCNLFFWIFIVFMLFSFSGCICESRAYYDPFAYYPPVATVPMDSFAGTSTTSIPEDSPYDMFRVCEGIPSGRNWVNLPMDDGGHLYFNQYDGDMCVVPPQKETECQSKTC